MLQTYFVRVNDLLTLDKPMSTLDSVFENCSRPTDSRPYVVAEMACAHEGNVDRALSIARAASTADAVQIQLFQAEKLVVGDKVPDVRRYELNSESWKTVVRCARDCRLDLWATVFHEEAIELALELQADVLKVHSTDVSNPGLLHACAKTGLPISLSTGGSTLDEIHKAVQYIEQAEGSKILLMHGFQAFPTQPSEARLRFLNTLQQLFPYPVGYQDHTGGDDSLASVLPIAAAAMGAAVLEKHIVDDRLRQGTDYESALGPEEFSRFISMVKRASEAFYGETVLSFSEAEAEYRQSMKKRVVARTKIPAKTKITSDVLVFLRADEGYPISRIGEVLGRTSKRVIEAQQPITEGMLY